jgi:IclR family pca regulon transcriptional regulator
MYDFVQTGAGPAGRQREVAMETIEKSDPDFMQSLARGLAVLNLFEAHESVSMSEAAGRTGLSRAVVRRCLHTLFRLGYVRMDAERRAFPTTALLGLSQAYLSHNRLAKAAAPILKDLSAVLDDSCSLGVLDGGQIVYVARAEVRRFISIDLQVGSRLPAYCTSMGRVLLAALEPQSLDAYLATTPLMARTASTITDPKRLRAALAEVAVQGFAVIDEELEPGLHSLAVAVRDRGGEVVAALNVGTARRTTGVELKVRALTALQHTSRRLTEAL